MVISDSKAGSNVPALVVKLTNEASSEPSLLIFNTYVLVTESSAEVTLIVNTFTPPNNESAVKELPLKTGVPFIVIFAKGSSAATVIVSVSTVLPTVTLYKRVFGEKGGLKTPLVIVRFVKLTSLGEVTVSTPVTYEML